MYLILMRHGEAVPQTEDVPNRERRLTKEGKKQVRTTSRMLARFLKDLSCVPARRRGSCRKNVLPKDST